MQITDGLKSKVYIDIDSKRIEISKQKYGYGVKGVPHDHSQAFSRNVFIMETLDNKRFLMLTGTSFATSLSKEEKMSQGKGITIKIALMPSSSIVVNSKDDEISHAK